MTKHLLLLAAFAAPIGGTGQAWGADGVVAEQANRPIPCTCRFKGRDIAVGETMCLDLPGGAVLARCDKVLNNTAWKTLQQGCPTASRTIAPSRSRAAG
ncbi:MULTISPECIES: hypothetical protein [unclassified Roseitalea]|uniref:hypothetical protein n=1 Tax=unclassified Roseitalea TaxID=2639107 RepID=UPI00273E5E7B|nr:MULTISPECIES: hypothetical protein [unclassified Roseitalea]